jgi:hypothetical protein
MSAAPPVLAGTWSLRGWSNGAPDFTVSADVLVEVSPNAERGVIGIAVVWPESSVIQLSRRDPDGALRPVRGGVPMRTVTVVDGEAPLDVPVTYVVTNAGALGGQIETAPVVLPSLYRTYLTHPRQVNAPMVVDLLATPDLTRDVETGVFWPLGAIHPVVITGPRRAPQGDITFSVTSFEQRDALVAYLSDVVPLLLRAPADYGMGVALWLAISSVTESRGGRPAYVDALTVAGGFVVVDSPPDVGDPASVPGGAMFLLLYPGDDVFPGATTFTGPPRWA